MPSYTFSSSAEVSVTVRLLISSSPSTISNTTFVKFAFVFSKSSAVSSIGSVPASVPLTLASPLNVKSASVYSGSLISTSYPVTVCALPSYSALPLCSVIVTVTSSVIGVIVSWPSTTTTLIVL